MYVPVFVSDAFKSGHGASDVKRLRRICVSIGYGDTAGRTAVCFCTMAGASSFTVKKDNQITNKDCTSCLCVSRPTQTRALSGNHASTPFQEEDSSAIGETSSPTPVPTPSQSMVGVVNGIRYGPLELSRVVGVRTFWFPQYRGARSAPRTVGPGESRVHTRITRPAGFHLRTMLVMAIRAPRRFHPTGQKKHGV